MYLLINTQFSTKQKFYLLTSHIIQENDGKIKLGNQKQGWNKDITYDSRKSRLSQEKYVEGVGWAVPPSFCNKALIN